MREPPHKRHPLDDENASVVERPEPIELPEGVNRQLLKPSIIALSVGFAIAFLAGVAVFECPTQLKIGNSGLHGQQARRICDARSLLPDIACLPYSAHKKTDFSRFEPAMV